jgi:hypothetical protein
LLLVFFFFPKQINPMLLKIVGFPLPFKGAITSFKPIYKCHWHNGGFFSFFIKDDAMTFFKFNQCCWQKWVLNVLNILKICSIIGDNEFFKFKKNQF